MKQRYGKKRYYAEIRKDYMKTGIPEVLKTVFGEPNRQSEQQDNNNEW